MVRWFRRRRSNRRIQSKLTRTPRLCISLGDHSRTQSCDKKNIYESTTSKLRDTGRISKCRSKGHRAVNKKKFELPNHDHVLTTIPSSAAAAHQRRAGAAVNHLNAILYSGSSGDPHPNRPADPARPNGYGSRCSGCCHTR